MMGNSSFYSSVCGYPKMETPRNYDFYGFQIIYLEDKRQSTSIEMDLTPYFHPSSIRYCFQTCDLMVLGMCVGKML